MCSAELADKDPHTRTHTHLLANNEMLIQHNHCRDSFTHIWNACNYNLKIAHFAPRYPAHFKAIVYIAESAVCMMLHW